MTADGQPRTGEVDPTVTAGRTLAVGLVAGVLLLTLLAGLYDLSIGFTALTAPAALLGLVNPVLGYRIHVRQWQRIPADAQAADRRACYLRSIVLPLAVSEGVATLGVVSFALGGGAFSLVGVLTHLLLTGALWPSADRLSRFLDSGAGPVVGGSS